MAKDEYLSRKGPHRMATAYKPGTQEEVAETELTAELDAFAKRLHGAIQEGRSKMSDEEVVEADKKAKDVLDRATSAVKSSRQTA